MEYFSCVQCGSPLPAKAPGGHQARKFCNDACRQAHYRKRHQVAAPVQDQAELARLLAEARQEIEELQLQNMRLQNKLDVDRRYHQDTSVYGFTSWLKKQPATPLAQKLLAGQFLPVRGSRSLYEAHLRKNEYTPDELAEFAHLWKAMLLQS